MPDEPPRTSRLYDAITSGRETGRHRRLTVAPEPSSGEWVAGSSASEMGSVIGHLVPGDEDEPVKITLPVGATSPLPMRRRA